MPSISVIVPAYNVERWIGTTLESISAQTYTDFECIVIDDGSTDGTAEIITAHSKKDNRIRLIRQENQGVCAARNAGLDAATGTFITFLDGDDLWVPDFLQKMTAPFAKNSNAMLTYCHFTMFEDGSCRRKPHIWKNYQATGNIWWDMLLNAEFCMGAWLARRVAVDAVGRFNPALTIAEDRDFLLRLLAHICDGHAADAVCVPEELLLYRQRRGSGVHNARGALATEWDIMLPHIQHPHVPPRIRCRAMSFLAFKMSVIAACALRDFRQALLWYAKAIKIDPLHLNLYLLPIRKIIQKFSDVEIVDIPIITHK